MNEPRDSATLIAIIEYQTDKFMTEAACEATDALIAANPELKAVVPDDLIDGIIKLPDGRVADIEWRVIVVDPTSDST